MATRLRVSRWAFSLELVGAFALAASAKLQGQQYESPPEVLHDLAARSAADIDGAFVRDGDAAAKARTAAAAAAADGVGTLEDQL